MNVFVTGGTGFVGNEVIRHLLAAGHNVHCLVRIGSEDKLPHKKELSIHFGDTDDFESLKKGMDSCDAVIHLVGIIREFPGKGITFEKLHTIATRSVIQATIDSGISRYLQMSANGTRANAKTGYHQSKWQAEEAVRASKLDWTIFRPSLIYGKGGEFIGMMSNLIRKLPVVPVIGDGQYRMQPVDVKQVALSFVKALSRPETIGKTYHLGGKNSYSYDEIIDIFGKALGKKSVNKLHHPLMLMKPAVKLLQSIPQFPLASDQLTMLLEGNVCDPDEWAKAFDIEPEDFSEGLKNCL